MNFSGAFTRPGPYGGSFVNRTRILREIVEGIKRVSGNRIDLGARLSIFDTVPFKADPMRALNLANLGWGPGEFSRALLLRFQHLTNKGRWGTIWPNRCNLSGSAPSLASKS